MELERIALRVAIGDQHHRKLVIPAHVKAADRLAVKLSGETVFAFRHHDLVGVILLPTVERFGNRVLKLELAHERNPLPRLHRIGSGRRRKTPGPDDKSATVHYIQPFLRKIGASSLSTAKMPSSAVTNMTMPAVLWRKPCAASLPRW